MNNVRGEGGVMYKGEDFFFFLGGERCTDCVAWRLIYILCRHSDK